MEYYTQFIFKSLKLEGWKNFVRFSLACLAITSVHHYALVRSLDPRAFAFVDTVFYLKLTEDFFLIVAWSLFLKILFLFSVDFVNASFVDSKNKVFRFLGKWIRKVGSDRNLIVDLALSGAFFALVYSPNIISNNYFLILAMFLGLASFMIFVRTKRPNLFTSTTGGDSENSVSTLSISLILTFAAIAGNARAEYIITQNQMKLQNVDGSIQAASFFGFTSEGGLFLNSHEELQFIPHSAINSMTLITLVPTDEKPSNPDENDMPSD